MSGDVVNLRTMRKRRKREESGRKAEENRVLFGLTKAERLQRQTETEQTEKHLDGHLLAAHDSTPPKTQGNSVQSGVPAADEKNKDGDR